MFWYFRIMTGTACSTGNIRANPHVGLLFISFEERRRRIRVNGTANLSFDDPLLESFPGGQVLVRVTPEHIFPNCPRYIPKMQMVEASEYVPQEGCVPPAASIQRAGVLLLGSLLLAAPVKWGVGFLDRQLDENHPVKRRDGRIGREHPPPLNVLRLMHLLAGFGAGGLRSLHLPELRHVDVAQDEADVGVRDEPPVRTISTPIRRTGSGCCARAPSGERMAAPLKSIMA